MEHYNISYHTYADDKQLFMKENGFLKAECKNKK